MTVIGRDERDLENAAVLLEETTEEFVNPPTAQAMREAASDVRRIAATYKGAVEALRDLVEFVESIDGKADDFGELKVVARAKAAIAAAMRGQSAALPRKDETDAA